MRKHFQSPIDRTTLIVVNPGDSKHGRGCVRGRPCRGFTLVELLVTVTVIAILAALLLPGLSRAKAHALRIQCLNSQKQLNLVGMLYSGDNRESLVLNGAGRPRPSGPYLWVLGSNHAFEEGLVNPRMLIDPAYSLFAAYVRVAPMYKCPTDRSTFNIAKRKIPKVRSYALNSYMGTIASNIEGPLRVSSAFRVYHKTSQTASDRPAQRFVFMDVNPGSICTPGYGVSMDTDTFIHYPGSAHNGQAVIAFADGHLEAHKWLDPRTRREQTRNNEHLPHNEPAPRNRDLQWLRERTTSRR